MGVIWHDAPSEKLVKRPIKVPNSVSDNFGDSGVAHEALSQSAIEAALSFAKDGPQLVEAGAIRGHIGGCLSCPLKELALITKLDKQLARKRIGQPEGDKVNRMIAFPMGQVSTRVSWCGHTNAYVTATLSWRPEPATTEWAGRRRYGKEPAGSRRYKMAGSERYGRCSAAILAAT
jgi:hypothetical protein